MNSWWALLTIVAQVITLVLIASCALPQLKQSRFVTFFRKNSITVGFIVFVLATVGSLIYSDVIGYEPCKLCWFQRIFIYPQVLIFGIALWKNDVSVRIYGLVLAAIGGVIALFHYVGQIGFNPFGLECLAIGYSASCAKNFVLQYGYITIPLMAASACALVVVSLALSLKESKDVTSN